MKSHASLSIIFDKVGNSEIGLLSVGAYKLKRSISMLQGVKVLLRRNRS